MPRPAPPHDLRPVPFTGRLGAQWIVAGKAPRGTFANAQNQMRRAFVLPGAPKRAALYVASMGYHSGELNGRKLSAKMLGDFTNYEKRLFYDTHNVRAPSPHRTPPPTCIGAPRWDAQTSPAAEHTARARR